MKSITFINLPSHPDRVLTVYPPVGIMSMVGCLKREGVDVEFIDADVLKNGFKTGGRAGTKSQA